MNARFLLQIALVPVLATASLVLAQAKAPVVSNLTAAQRPGTRVVDIAYDVTADTPAVKVSLNVSVDGGYTWTVPVTAVSGDVGAGIAVGTGKTIVWDAGVDWNQQYSAQTRYRVTADDTIPEGLALISAGAFTMGRTSGDTDSNAPPVTVNVSEFYMAKHEVTKALWDEVRAWGLANGYTDLPAGGGKAASHPVHTINWYAMVKWCNARSQKEGLTPCYTVSGATYHTGDSDAVVCNWSANGYRLPTEAEWEKAARGGISGKRFPWGTDTITHSQANYNSGTDYSYDLSFTRGYHPAYNDGITPYTAPVGSFAANGYGLFDMAGNVWEWCWDWYSASAYTDGATDPRGDLTGSYRVRRGGGWSSSSNYCRAAHRNNNTPGNTNNNIGFRVSRSSVPGATGSATTPNGVLDTRAWTLSSPPATGGSVQGAGSYPINTTAILTATPATGYIFSGWTGDASGATNPLEVLMDSDKTIGAVFAQDATDSDGDGLSAFLEQAIYGTDPALADTDGDGLSDAWEVGLGRFSIVAGSFTWEQARADAKAKGGELACFPDAHRWDRAMETLGSGALDSFAGVWIGASDALTEGTWTWVNGESFSFSDWATTRPSTAPGNSLDYAEVNGGSGAELDKWYDRTALFIRDGYLLEIGYSTNPTTADSDGDGLSDGQEVNLTDTNPRLADSNGNGINDGLEDSDGDGFSNLFEIENGFHPGFASSTPELLARITIVPLSSPTAVEVRFNAAQGVSYRIEDSTDLEKWNPVETGILGAGGVVTRFYSTENQPTRYFRARRN